MKNIHLIPTENNSPLVHSTNKYGGYSLSRHYYPMREMGDSYQHIYITSDEEIKEGDWLFSSKTNNIFKADSIEYLESHNMIEDFNKSFYINSKYSKKIILTTDQDLIKDGVQSIDDKFLEWFVKNPSCERVEVESNYRVKSGTIEEHKQGVAGYEYYKYKIIIPQDEAKTNLESLPFPELVEELAKYYEKVPLVEEPKQETVEEAAEIYIKADLKKTPLYWLFHDSFIAGAKWQQERMYSEEEVFNLCGDFAIFVQQKRPSYKKQLEWFKQFKKK
jgi:translation initiation factor 2 beta subunit (eIF-2beta)/eIF-5